MAEPPLELEILPRPGQTPRSGRPSGLKLAGFKRICARIREGKHRWSKERAAQAEGISYETLRRRAKRQDSWRKYLTYSERVGEEATLDYHRQNMTDHSAIDWRASERYVLMHDPNFARLRLTNNLNNGPNVSTNDEGEIVLQITARELSERFEKAHQYWIAIQAAAAAQEHEAEPAIKAADAKLVEFPRENP